jgi:UDP-N-acetylglucosamine transferase subunit ALG13
MILLTVGKQLPFDRLVGAVDALAPHLAEPVVAQIGQDAAQPNNMEAHAKLSAMAFEELAARSSLLVSHAGIGSVLLARRLQKPIVLMPRRAEMGEHRNDHQLATARQLERADGVLIAWDETDLDRAIELAMATKAFAKGESASLAKLRETTAHFIATGDTP